MTAPNPKEALEPCPFCGGEAESDSQRGYRNISTGNPEKSAAIYCTKCSSDMTWCYRDTPEIEREQVMSLLIEQWNTRPALATLSPPAGERREAIARCIIGPRLPVPKTSPYSLEELRDVRWKNATSAERCDALNAADAIIASGLVQDEAAIRADERERCAKIAEREAEFWQDTEASSARIVAANIRSARDGGAET